MLAFSRFFWIKKILLLFLIILRPTFAISAPVKPHQQGKEKRFLAWTYKENEIFHFTGYYLNPTYIEFESGETVQAISSPKGSAWEFDDKGNRLFLKPIENNADTTATIITNKRTYFFELHAKEPSGPFDVNVPFFVRFRYPEQSTGNTKTSTPKFLEYNNISRIPDLSDPKDKNFNYTVSGDQSIKPEYIFDDGKFTYMQFKDKQPAIFAVNDVGTESVVNSRNEGDYAIIEEIGPIFSLRLGALTVCVFNENMLVTSEDKKSRKRRLFGRRQ